MKFSENWLRELVEIPVDRAALARALTMIGHEVESLTALGEGLAGVVVAEIVAMEKHPEADRLNVCKVDAGQGALLTIVCGAPNARVGLKAPLATVGAVLQGGLTIKAAKLRGIESSGMLCSAKELGLDSDASGLLELPPDAPVGKPLAAYLGLPDASIELGLTPNRPDCLGMLGIAGDLAALYGGAVKAPAQDAVAITGASSRGIRLEAGSDCPRYLGRVIEGIDLSAPSPLWLVERLRRAGLRPINAVVDVTNYVMLETGQPLHAFDNDALQGDIVVRHARAGETLKLLDGSAAELAEDFMLIADEGKPLAVAGVMGGFDSRVTETTRNVFLEAAHFAPAAIMGRARRLGLHTDASHRFERGVDPGLPRRALERATSLLLSIAGGEAGPALVAERVADIRSPDTVVLRRARLARVLGIAVDDAEVERILRALDMAVERTADGWRATPPSRRFDIEREEDLIEEVARIHGYERIPTRAPGGELVLAPLPEQRLPVLALAEQLAARDYFEAVTMAFVAADLLRRWGLDEDAVALANPLSVDLAVMRSSLLPGLVEALRHNRARQQERVRLFEHGHVFLPAATAGEAPCEPERLALVACGAAVAEQWSEASRAVDFHDLKGDVESLLALGGEPQRWRFDADGLPRWLHPGRGARLLRDDAVAGYLGELHPDISAALDLPAGVLLAEFDLDLLSQRRLPQARPVPRFPAVRRDLAVEVADDLPWAAVERSVRRALGERLAEVRLFDQYQGPGLDPDRKSLAMGLILQDASRTLTDEEVDSCVKRALSALEKDCAARLRG
jgi:phenylalanyl-tRNA synthetase beta chain